MIRSCCKMAIEIHFIVIRLISGTRGTRCDTSLPKIANVDKYKDTREKKIRLEHGWSCIFQVLKGEWPQVSLVMDFSFS